MSSYPRNEPRNKPRNEREIALDGQNNFRDLGGHKTLGGRRVKLGRVYRSGELVELSDRDVDVLAELDVQTVIDLRGEQEALKKGPDRLPGGASLKAIPIEPGDLSPYLDQAFATGDYSSVPSDLLQRINRDYIKSWGHRLAEVLRVAADDRHHAIVLHCTQGKDRAGISAAILLSALGVPWEIVLQDYLYSNIQRAEQARLGLASLQKGAARRRKIPPADVDMAGIRGLFYVDASYLEAAKAEAREGYGSLAAFIREGIGFGDDEVRRLRECLLE
jgi:protein-tyrosine phosphatase